MTTIVKRRSQKQDFDERKVYASVYAACLNVHLGEAEAERIAAKVSGEITTWLKAKLEISSQEIFDQVYKLLKKYNQYAAFMYQTHRDVS